MSPLKLFKLFRDYEKFNSIVKENATMNTKVTQIVTLLVTVIGAPSTGTAFLEAF